MSWQRLSLSYHGNEKHKSLYAVVNLDPAIPCRNRTSAMTMRRPYHMGWYFFFWKEKRSQRVLRQPITRVFNETQNRGFGFTSTIQHCDHFNRAHLRTPPPPHLGGSHGIWRKSTESSELGTPQSTRNWKM